MNNLTTKLIGAGVGAGVGWFVGSVIVEIIALKQWNSEHAGEEPEYHETSEYPELEGDIDVIRQGPKGMAKKTTRNYSEIFEKRPDLQMLVEKYNGGDSDQDLAVSTDLVEDEMDDDELEKEDEDVDVPSITIISMSDFANAEGFQTLTLSYYDDDVVTDEHDVPIDHPEQILGDDALISFGELSGDEDVVYVRNMDKKAMYEVVRTNRSYAVKEARRAKKRSVVSRLKEEDDGEGNAE